MNEKVNKVLDLLKSLDIEYIYYKHKPIFSVKEWEHLHKKFFWISTKTLFLKDKNKTNFLLVSMLGEKRLNIKNLENKLGYKKLSFGNSDELDKFLDVYPWSVSPFALINDKKRLVDLIFDREVWESEYVSFHPNFNRVSLDIKTKDFKKFVDWLWINIKILDLD